jgi:TolB-like protein
MPPDPVRFGDFELDSGSYELRRAGSPVRLERIPMEILLALAENPGRLMPRRELVARVWGKDHFFEEESALNTAMRKLRVALGDSVEQPRFIETVTGKGYRFVAGAALPAVRPARTLLAVLPFENLSKDSGESYLSDGVTDELTTCLGEQSPAHLGVIGRTTAIECHRRGLTVDQVGRELGVHFVVEGSVKGSAGRVRVNVRLVQVRDQAQIWAKSYSREIGDLLVWQSEVAQEIAGEVNAAMPAAALSARTRGRRVDPLAYESYLKGLHQWNKRTPPGYLRSIPFFEQAIDLDPTYALSYAGLANTFILLGIHGVRSPEDTYPKARAAARKALEIDPALPEAHAALGDVSKGFDWDWRQAESSYCEAIRENFNYALAHQWYANLLSIMERHDEAIHEAEESRRLDPLSAPAAGFVAFTLYRARRFDDALREAEKAIELNPSSAVVNWFLALIYLQLGDHGLAEKASLTALRDSNEGAMYVATLACVLARAGQPQAALEIVRTLERRSLEQYISPLDMCVAYAGFEDREASLAWLEKAVDRHVMRATEIGMPLFEVLRQDPRCQELVRLVGLAGRQRASSTGFSI